MKPGDIIKIKLSGDVHEAKVIDCRNKKTIWVEVLWNKTRIHALTPKEKKAVAEQKLSLDGLSEQEKALAMLAQRGKKIVHQHGTKRIKIPRAKVVNAEPFVVHKCKSTLKREAIQKAAEGTKPKALSSDSQQPQPTQNSTEVEIFKAGYTVQPKVAKPSQAEKLMNQLQTTDMFMCDAALDRAEALEAEMVETAEDSMQTSPKNDDKQEASEPRQLSKLEQMKARIKEKKGE